MEQKWIRILVILVFYQKLTSGVEEKRVKENGEVDISCSPDCTGLVHWFRALDNSKMEYIATSNPKLGSTVKIIKKNISDKKINEKIIVLKSFNKDEDSGVYTCVCIKSNELNFGQITRLLEDKPSPAVTVKPTTTTTTSLQLSTTTRACACNNKNRGQAESIFDLNCSPVILGPLAGACGLILLLLILTILYCNQIRTRRCPHHYKRRPRNMAPGKQMMTNRHI
ncbi:hypothetical protein Q5P01_001957 [Channa striata]|uniref:Immunoglobulin V-set domain-containing protein n=1 Tax=Channa striata TaxID=64152 RepID=A0AA88NQD8_CHASR|nr:hypothetical protein Q5P01_001957 [Channa striata]